MQTGFVIGNRPQRALPSVTLKKQNAKTERMLKY